MNKTTLGGFHLAGLKFKGRTTNANGQLAIDCGNLWQEFMNDNYVSRIDKRSGDDMYAVYYNYESDHTGTYAYFIGCAVKDASAVPAGMDHLFIPEEDYVKLTAQGQMPDCVANKWHEIWQSDTRRAYQFDFEVYDQRSKDWSNATVDIYLSV